MWHRNVCFYNVDTYDALRTSLRCRMAQARLSEVAMMWLWIVLAFGLGFAIGGIYGTVATMRELFPPLPKGPN